MSLPYEVGDEFEGSQSEASKFIKTVLNGGGLVEIDGKIVRVIYVPPKEIPKEAEKPVKVTVLKDDPVPEPEPVVKEDPVVEEYSPRPRRGRRKNEEVTEEIVEKETGE